MCTSDEHCEESQAPDVTVHNREGVHRLRDRNGYRQRAAAFCARLTSPPTEKGTEFVNKKWSFTKAKELLASDGLEVLMVSGRTSGERYWVLPGGGVESMETTEDAVVRELREEAGILGRVLFCIGEFIDDHRLHHTTLYFLTVVEQFTAWSEHFENGRQRCWMGLTEARRHIKHNQLGMLERSIEIIERTFGEQHMLLSTVRSSLLTEPIISGADIGDGTPKNGQMQKMKPSKVVGKQKEMEAKNANGTTTATGP